MHDRSSTVSVFNGPPPAVKTFESYEDEIAGVAEWLAGLHKQVFEPHEIGVIVRSDNELDRAEAALKKADIPHRRLDRYIQTGAGKRGIVYDAPGQGPGIQSRRGHGMRR